MELKPCKHCQAEGIDLDFGGGGRKTYVYCSKCGSRGPRADGDVGAELAWNTRPTTPEVAALVEALRAHLFSDGTHAALESALFRFTKEAPNG